MERQATGIGRVPLVSRGSLADWEREFRARLAVTEEGRELTRMREEVAQMQGEIARLQAERSHLHGELGRSQGELARSQGEIQQLRRALKTAEKILQGLRNSRGYRLFRLFGRWDSLEQNIHRTFR